MSLRRPNPPAASASSLHAQILAETRSRILTGAWPPGMRIPFEQELAAHYGCARMTVNKVMTELVRAGLVERRRKAGTFVARPRSQAAVLDIHDIGREVTDLGLRYDFTLLERHARNAPPEEAAALDIPSGTPLLDLTCLHRAGGQPFCLERRRISLAAVPEAEAADFTILAPGPWLTAEVPWTEAEHRIRAAAADRASALALSLPAASPCLVIERRTWSGGRLITVVTLTYPGEAHQLVARFTPAAG